MAALDDLPQEIHEWARGKGFYNREFVGIDVTSNPVRNPSLAAEKVALIMSEGAEVLEALRDEDKENEAEELADIIIRVLDYAAWRGFNMDAEIGKKVEKNRGRPHLHGRTF